MYKIEFLNNCKWLEFLIVILKIHTDRWTENYSPQTHMFTLVSGSSILVKSQNLYLPEFC